MQTDIDPTRGKLAEGLLGDRDFSELMREIRMRISRNYGEVSKLSLDELDQILPAEIIDPELIGLVIEELEIGGVNLLLDGRREVEDSKAESPKHREDKEVDILVRNAGLLHEDSTSQYFALMGRSQLLSRERELDIARGISAFNKKTVKFLCRYRFTYVAAKEIIRERLEGKARLEKIFRQEIITDKEAFQLKLLPLMGKIDSLIESTDRNIGILMASENSKDDITKDSTTESKKAFTRNLRALRKIFGELKIRYEHVERIIPLLAEYYQKARDLKGEEESQEFHRQTWRETKSFMRETVKFLDEYKQFQKIKNELIVSNLRLVISIAKRYARAGVQMADLIQEGNIGLMRAVDRFRHKHGYKFSTYATWWIRQAISRYISEHSRVVRVPVYMIDNMIKIQKIERELSQKLGRKPELHELAQVSDLSAKKISEITRVFQSTVSLNQKIGDGEDGELTEIIADPNAKSPDEILANKQILSEIKNTLGKLNDVERKILEKRFGINQKKAMTLEEIGSDFQLTRERIRQIEARALKKLRHPSRSYHILRYLEDKV